MGRQAIAPLPAAHLVDVAAAVELRSALAQTQQGTGAGLERNRATVLVNADLLHLLALGIPNGKRKRIGRELHAEIAGLKALRACDSPKRSGWSP